MNQQLLKWWAVGISWITNQGLCYLSVLCYPQEEEGDRSSLVTHVCGHDCVSIWWGRVGRRKWNGNVLDLPPFLVKEGTTSCLYSFSMLPASCEESQLTGTLACHHPAKSWCQNLLCSGAGRTRSDTQKWMNDLNNRNCDLLYTHCQLDAFVCNLYHIFVREGWPHFTDEKAEV